MSPELWEWLQKLGWAGIGYGILWLSFKRKWIWSHELDRAEKSFDARMAEKIVEHARQLSERDLTIRELKQDRDRLLGIALRQAAVTAASVSVLEKVMPTITIPEKVGDNT